MADRKIFLGLSGKKSIIDQEKTAWLIQKKSMADQEKITSSIQIQPGTMQSLTSPYLPPSLSLHPSKLAHRYHPHLSPVLLYPHHLPYAFALRIHAVAVLCLMHGCILV